MSDANLDCVFVLEDREFLFQIFPSSFFDRAGKFTRKDWKPTSRTGLEPQMEARIITTDDSLTQLKRGPIDLGPPSTINFLFRGMNWVGGAGDLGLRKHVCVKGEVEDNTHPKTYSWSAWALPMLNGVM